MKPSLHECIERLQNKIPRMGTLVGRSVKIKGAKAVQGIAPYIIYNYDEKNYSVSVVSMGGKKPAYWCWDYGDIESLLDPLSIEELLLSTEVSIRNAGLFVKAVVDHWEPNDCAKGFREYCSRGEVAMKDIKERCEISKEWAKLAVKEFTI